ncbi:MAG: lamin tail domain-containing protein, partial [Planctomycetota bacterium]
AVELGVGEYLVLEEAGLGFSLHVSNRLFLYAPCRCVVADAVRLQEGLSGRLPAREAGWGAPSAATFGSANQFNLSDQIVINEIYYNPADEPVAGLEPVVGEVIVPIEQAWNYSASGANLGTQWRDPGFDDGAWETGGALLYHESGSLPAAKTTELPLGATTYYFRSRFELDADPLAVELYFRSVIDDGAVIYLNGEEVLRLRMPAGEIDSGTFASASVSNADYEGPFLVTGNALRRGENLIAVEVHQRTSGSSDVVFGLEASVLDLAPGKEKVASGESREKWVELFNRGSEAVELSDWRLSSGIRYTFGAGESIGPGEYLVVAGDREHLESIHPGVRIVGDFAGNLSGRSDRIVLRDALGNPADEVRYFDDGPWPIYADGGGSSIELIDPDSDNNNSGSWSDSDEGARAQWQSYSYQETARPNVGPSRWRELCLGLLRAGEVFIDDLSVVEDPGGAGRQLIANGSFESGESGWRLLGNHGHSEVVEDPADPGNRVLRLVATGATEHMHNHVEATLAGGASITNGRLYEISFRAKWIAGSNQVHTRLYFNRCPKTTLVERPENPGTPGSRNSRFLSNAGPTFTGLR